MLKRVFCSIILLGFYHGSVPGSATLPINLTVPVISNLTIPGDRPTVGQTLSATNGIWSQCIPSCSYTYRWYNEGFVISGATSSTYTLTTSDLGDRITVDVIATNGFGPAITPALSIVSESVISATTRYVSNSSGNDSWDGTAPAFVSGVIGPWKTLAKVNQQVFAAGTSILFKRGDKWDRSAGPSVVGQLKPSTSADGASNNPIVYDSYGTGADPILDGSADASHTTDWQLVPGSTTVWESVQTFYPATAKTVTFSGSIGTPIIVTWITNGPINGSSVIFATTGSLPTGLTAGTIYYVVGTSGSTFNVSATYNGTAINVGASLGSGTQTAGANGLPYIDANDIGNVLWGFTALGGTTPSAVMSATVGVEKGGLNTGGFFVYYKPGDGPNNIGTTNGNWNFNTDNFRVQIVSNGSVNPANAFPGLRLALDSAPVYIQDSNWSTFQNLTIQNTANAAVYIFPGTSVTGITIRDNVMQWIGGGNNGGQNQSGRIGDAINTANTMDTLLFERNFIYQVYDGGISPQTSPANRNNMIIRNNIITRYGACIGILNTPSSGPFTQDGLYIYSNTCYDSTSWSMTPTLQRPNGDTQRKSMNLSYNANMTVTNQDFRDNVFAGSSALGNNSAFGLTSYTCPDPPLTCTLTGATWLNFNYNNWSAVNGNPTTYIGTANPSLATWFSNHSFEANSVIDINPSLINTTNDFRPTVGSPLRNAGANLFGNGVVWDFSRLPRPSSGNFTIGAYQ